MQPKEMIGRYAHAKALAATLLQAVLCQECEFEEVVTAFEQVALWKLAMSSGVAYTNDTWAIMIEHTKEWNRGGHQEVG